jgi:hypothetical protein
MVTHFENQKEAFIETSSYSIVKIVMVKRAEYSPSITDGVAGFD